MVANCDDADSDRYGDSASTDMGFVLFAIAVRFGIN